MAASPSIISQLQKKQYSGSVENGHANPRFHGDEDETSESEDSDESIELREEPITEDSLVALACDDGCVRIYSFSDSEQLTYNKSLPRVSGEKAAPFN